MNPKLETLRASVESVAPVSAAEAIERARFRHRRRVRTLAGTAAALACVAGLAVLGGDGDGSSAPGGVAAAPRVTDPTAAVQTALGTGGPSGGSIASTTIEGYLPNALYDGEGGARPVYERVVVGAVGDLTSIRSYGIAGAPGSDSAQSRELATAHPDVEFREVEIALDVERDLGTQDAAGSLTIGFTLPANVDPEAFAEGLRRLRRVVWFLNPTVNPEDDPSVLTPGFQSRLLAPVAGDGALSLPYIEASFAQALLRQVNRLDALIRANETPPAVRQRGT